MTAKADMSWSMRPTNTLWSTVCPCRRASPWRRPAHLGERSALNISESFPFQRKRPGDRSSVTTACGTGFTGWRRSGRAGCWPSLIRFTPSCLRILWHLRPKSKMAKKRNPAATVFIPIGRAAVRSLKCFRMTRMAGDKKSTVRRCKTRS